MSIAVGEKQILSLILERHKERLQEKPQAKISAAYQIAMQLEKDSYNYYKKLAGQFSEKVIQIFFDLLAREENAHYAILQEALVYLDKPKQWFWAKEDWIIENE